MSDNKSDELARLLKEALGHDTRGAALPEDPYAFNASNVTSWNDIAGVLAAYPNGLPAGTKNQLLNACKQLTQQGHANPDLAVQVARMPVLGGSTTRIAKSAVQAGGKRRTGLTRAGGGMSIAKRPVPMADELSRPHATAPQVVSPDKLRSLEEHAAKLQGLLENTSPNNPGRATVLLQTTRAWQTLQEALEARMKHLQTTGATRDAIGAYEKAISQVAAVVKGLR